LKSLPIDETDWRRYGVMTVKQFLTKDIDGEYKRPPVCITTDGSLYTAAKYMIDHHIHRVWAISPVEVAGVQGFGVGCVSLTDVIRIVNNFSTVQP
jgi:CBS domain-containing protein